MKILIIAPSWVGDMMMSHSLYRTLTLCFPSVQLDVMAPDWCRPLLARMPEVNHAIPMPIGHGSIALTQRRQLGLGVRQQHYDRAYVLPNSFKSALIPYFAKIPIRIGWRGEMRYGVLNDIRILDKQAFPLLVQRYVALAYPKDQVKHSNHLPQPLLWPVLQTSPLEISQTIHTFQLSPTQPYIGFCPGAEFGPAKRWPHYHYTVLAQYLIQLGYQILLFGSEKDAHIGQQILHSLPQEQQPYCLNLAGKTTLDQAINLIATCQAVVSNDSGLMHIAAALNTPLVALYGPTSPQFTPPLSNKTKILRLITGYHKIRHGAADQGYHQSLIDLSPQQVLEALQHLLTDNGSATCMSC